MGCSTSSAYGSQVEVSCTSDAAFVAAATTGRRQEPQRRSEAQLREAQAAHVQKVLRFRNKCEEAQIGWVRFGYLRETKGRVAPRRQDLPTDVLVVGAPPARTIRWVISHPWLAKQHPDITGEQLAEVVGALQRLGAVDGDVVFFDWLSMFQPLWGLDDRSAEEKRLFSLGLKSMNMLYSSDLCKVVVVSQIPPSARKDKWRAGSLSLDCACQSRELWLEPNPTPYFARGWCFFELFTTLLFGTAAEFSEDMCSALTEVLRAMFSVANFAFESDMDKVSGQVGALIVDFHDSEKWAKRVRKMEESWESGLIKLVRVSYLRRLRAAGERLVRRQDVPPEALAAPDETSWQRLFVVSHCWQTVEHPDPDGWRLKNVVQKLDNLEADEDDLVFVDYMCFVQEWDWAAQHSDKWESFANVLSMDSRARTIVSWQMPPGFETRVYEERGWCLAELVLSAFAGTLVFDDREVVDIVLEKSFMRALRAKTFTNGKTDMGIVADLFKGLLYERAGLSQLRDSLSSPAQGA